MIAREAIAAAVGSVVSEWLRTSPGLPLVLMADQSGSVSASIGHRDRSRISGTDAAALLGVSRSSFYRRGFYNLPRGSDGKFSRLQVQRLKESRAA